MKTLIKILCLSSFLFAEDVYPYFSDPVKQFKFEKKRIYIIDEKGERQIISGGDSYSKMANPLGVIFLSESPQYLAITNPIKTSIEYWYQFDIKQNNESLNELEFLNLIGLRDEAEKIINSYNEKLKIYNKNNTDYKVRLENYNKELKTYELKKGFKNSLLYLTGSTFLITAFVPDCLVCSSTTWDDENKPQWTLFLSSLVLSVLFAVSTEELEEPMLPKKNKPKLNQTLSNKQLISLSESYNKKIYKEIKNSQ